MDPKLKMGLLLVSSFFHAPFQWSRGESEQLVFAAVASARFTCSRLLRRSDTNENLDDAAMAIIDYAMDWNMLQVTGEA